MAGRRVDQGFEFLRGDGGRSYLGGFSQAQWTSLALIAGVAAASAAGILPPRTWPSVSLATVALAMLAVAFIRAVRPRSGYGLFQARHIGEIARAVQELSRDGEGSSGSDSQVRVFETSLGLLLSMGRVEAPGLSLTTYSMSLRESTMTEALARGMCRLLMRLRRETQTGELLSTNGSVFHLVIAE